MARGMRRLCSLFAWVALAVASSCTTAQLNDDMDDMHASVEAARAARERGDLEQAARSMEEAIGQAKTLRFKSVYALDSSNEGEVAEGLRGNIARWSIVLAHDWMQLGRHEECLEATDDALDSWYVEVLAPEARAIVHVLRGQALLALGRSSEAQQELDAARAEKPDAPGIAALADALSGRDDAMRRAREHADARRWPEAIEAYTRALELHPDVAATEGRAIACFHAGRYAESFVDFDAVVANRPQNGTARYNRALASYHLGRPEDALRDLDQALGLGVDTAAARVLRGMCFEVSRPPNDAAALAEFERALSLDGKNFDALEGCARIQARRGDIERALRNYQRALELGSPSAAACIAELRARPRP